MKTQSPTKITKGASSTTEPKAHRVDTKRITGKQRAFIQYVLEHPKEPAKNAAMAAYGVTGNLAESMASENLSKPKILLELQKHSNTAEITLIEVMNTSREYSKKGNTAGASYANTAQQIANSILDRLHGKATQRIQQETTAVTLNIDLTSTS